MDVEVPPEELQPRWKRPLVIIGAVFILLVLVIAIFPIYLLKVNPPPDQNAVSDFKLQDYEVQELSSVNSIKTSSITTAVSNVNIADYRTITTRLVSSACSEHSDLCYARAIYSYVQELKYVSDPVDQYVQSPTETLLSGAGDCEDFALLTCAMLESIGLDADIGVTSDHAFVRVQVSSSWFGEDYTWIDPTSNEPFGEVSFTNKEVLDWIEVAA